MKNIDYKNYKSSLGSDSDFGMLMLTIIFVLSLYVAI